MELQGIRDGDFLAGEFHGITGEEFAAAAGFDFAVDFDLAVLNEKLGFASAGGDGGELEKLVETEFGVGRVVHKRITFERFFVVPQFGR